MQRARRGSGEGPSGRGSAIAARARGRLLLPGYLVAAIVLANLPTRLGLAAHEARAGVSEWVYVPIGLLVDCRDHLLVYVLTNLLVAALAWAAYRLARAARPVGGWRGALHLGRATADATTAHGFHGVLSRTVPVWTTMLFIFTLISSAMAAEFRIERGIYPTMFDLDVGLGITSLLNGTLSILALDRFRAPSIVAVTTFALATRYAWRHLPSCRRFESWREPTVLVTASALVSLGCFGIHRAAPHLFRSLQHWRVVGSAPAVFFGSSSDYGNIQLGALSLFRRLALAESLRAPGAAMLGFDPASVERLVEQGAGCQPHPLAQPLGLDGDPVAASAGTAPGYLPALEAALRDLSSALFRGRAEPLRLWQLSLESFRGDDLNALNPAAPRAIAPVTNGLYEAARSGGGSVIVAEQHYGSGTRTSQGLSAMTCGLGTVPLSLAFSRDLGLQPMRCLPDVLRDASFEGAFYYGAAADFDNMRAFLNYHGIDHIVSKLDFQRELWNQSWNAPDWAPDLAVLDRALEDSAARPAERAQYNVVMSLTNHFPFVLPGDAPPEIVERVAAAVAQSGRPLSRDEVARLETFSYTDYALGWLLERLSRSADADHTIVVATADHSTVDPWAWQDRAAANVAEQKVARSRIPLLIVLPDALLRRAPEPDRARDAVRQINALLARHATSQNDIPRLILALLHHTAELNSLPPQWRWHSLGGQRLSTYFAPHHPPATVLGIDALSRILLVGDDPPGPLAFDAMVRTTFDPEQIGEYSPDLLPAAAFLAAFVQSYGDRCWQASNIRSAP